MTHHERDLYRPLSLWRIFVVPAIIGAILGFAIMQLLGCTPTEAKPPQQIVVDDTLCNAKYANWIIRHEELAKPQPEQYHNFKRHMGECVR